jgi:hypothetical protein
MGNSVKGAVVFILFLFVTVCLSAQIIDTAWTKTFGGEGWEDVYSVQQTSDGGYIIAGYTESYGGDDIYLIKTDFLGDTLWTRTYGGNDGWHVGHSVKQTSDGGYIVAGNIGISTVEDAYLLKTDSMGDSLWAKTYRSDDWEGIESVQQTTDGGYILIGTKAYNYTDEDFYLLKTDSMGDSLWAKTIRGSNCEYAKSGQQTTDGGYIIAGCISYCFTTLDRDVYLIKTDSLGDTLWTRTYGGTLQDEAYSVRQTDDGGYILVGFTRSYGAGGDDDIYVLKTDSMGDTLWTKTFGRGYGYSGQQTTDGGYIIGGRNSSYGAGESNVYLIKTDSIGDTLWTKAFVGGDLTGSESFQQTTDGGYIIAVNTWSDSTWMDVYLLKIELFPGITITSPNGGEKWQSDGTYDITWTSYKTSGRVKIEYSLNNGLDWTGIITSTPDDGNYPWTIPDTMSYNCLVRISDTNGTLSDISNSVFTIYSEPFIEVTSPNGKEFWQVYSAYNITWASAGIGSDVKIEYSINNGSDWMSIEDTIPNTERYFWIIPFTPSDSCLVRIASLDGSISDISDSVFTIFSPPFITVTSPNGGEKWLVDSTYNITWTSYETSGAVKLEYSLNNGIDWAEIIASIPDTGAYPWTIPDTTSDSCLVRVSDTNELLEDISNSVFRISPPFITVISPNGGEEWQVGIYHNITWASAGTSGAVKIEYSLNNGIDWTEIIASFPDTGAYRWAIPDTPSWDCLVRVADTNGKVTDISDESFVIYPGSGTSTSETPEVYSLNVSGIATGSQVEFTYTLPEKANDIKFTLYNIAGLKIKEENLKDSPAGFYSGRINLSGISKGIYFIRMEANGGKFTQTRKFVLM